MEHVLFHLIIEGIQAIDRRLQKPLRSVVPDLGRLKAEPLEYLRQAPVVVGPRRRRALAWAIGLIIGGVAVLLLFVATHKRKKAFALKPGQVAGYIGAFAAVTFVAHRFSLYALRGGTMVLRPQGVELTQDDASLFLPWDLFYASGAIFEADQKNVVLPINASIPVAIGSDDDGTPVRAIAIDELESPLVECEEGQLALKDLYEVRLPELGGLIYLIGQRIGAAANPHGGPPVAPLPPLAVAEDKGWLRIHLTQLPLPPICAGCGDATTETLELPIALNRRSLTLAVPLCPACQSRRSKAANIAMLVGAVVGAALGAALGWVVMGNRKDDFWMIVTVLLALAIGIPMMLICRIAFRDNATPVTCKDYRPDRGTVKMKFRDPARSASLLMAMGVPVKFDAPGDAD